MVDPKTVSALGMFVLLSALSRADAVRGPERAVRDACWDIRCLCRAGGVRSETRKGSPNEPTRALGLRDQRRLLARTMFGVCPGCDSEIRRRQRMGTLQKSFMRAERLPRLAVDVSRFGRKRNQWIATHWDDC